MIIEFFIFHNLQRILFFNNIELCIIDYIHGISKTKISGILFTQRNFYFKELFKPNYCEFIKVILSGQ